MKTILTAIVLCVTVNVYSQTLSKNQVIQDLNFLVSSIEKYNPALYEYNPEFQSNTQQLIESVNTELNLLQHFGLVSKIIAESNEGHFNAGDWSDTIHSGFGNNVYSYLPLQLKVLNGELYVWDCYTEKQELQKGDKILSINNKKTETIIQSLYDHIPSDGNIETHLQRTLSLSFPWRYYLFVEQPDEFLIQVIPAKSNEDRKLTIDALQIAEMRENFKNRNKVSEEPEKSQPDNEVYTFEILENYALLKLTSFDYSRIKAKDLKSKKLYKNIFTELAENETHYLVIDLRNNTGGRNEFAADLIPYILKENQKGWFKKTISWKGKEKTYKLPRKNKWAFQGKIYVLVNGRTYSSGSSTARYLKEYTDAVIIGEETGTRYEGFAAGSTQVVYLPHSNIKIGIPRYHLKFPPSEKQTTKNRGLLPDVEITENIDDLINERDIQMEYVLGQIQN